MIERVMNEIENLTIEAGIYTRPDGRWGFEEFRHCVDAQVAHDDGADITDGATDDEK